MPNLSSHDEARIVDSKEIRIASQLSSRPSCNALMHRVHSSLAQSAPDESERDLKAVIN